MGSQISQLLANSLLADFDKQMESLVDFYIRYSDDMILLSYSKQKLKDTMEEASKLLEKLGLSLNKKSKITKLKNGLEFLKTRYLVKSTGKIILKKSKKTWIRWRRHFKNLEDRLRNEEGFPFEDLVASVCSWNACTDGKTRLSKTVFNEGFLCPLRINIL